jgi:RNA ligase (TIGR02306 family)
MSDLICHIETIREIKPHPNADRLEIAVVQGWDCITSKGQFAPGDKCVYIGIDAVLSESLVEQVFKDSKVKPHNGRIRAIKLRGTVSYGLLLDVKLYTELQRLPVGTEVSKELGVAKFEPPQQGAPCFKGQQQKKKLLHPDFPVYTHIQHLKKYCDVFTSEDIVVVTSKIHGTNVRASRCKCVNDTWWKRALSFIGFRKNKWEFIVGSHNVELKTYKETAFYKENVYQKIADELDLKSKLKNGEILYGEIFGPGIQKGYDYGQKKLAFRAFDLMRDGVFVDWDDLVSWCKEHGIETVPELYRGKYDAELVRQLATGASTFPNTPVKEGVVVRTEKEAYRGNVRAILKEINPDYLLNKNNTDFH